jgi:hypothetical protein
MRPARCPSFLELPSERIPLKLARRASIFGIRTDIATLQDLQPSSTGYETSRAFAPSPIRIALPKDDVVPHGDIFRPMRLDDTRNRRVGGVSSRSQWCPNAIRAGTLKAGKNEQKVKGGRGNQPNDTNFPPWNARRRA